MNELTMRAAAAGAALSTAFCMPCAAAAPIAIDCDAGGSITAGLKEVKPGDALLVSGTCRESVNIPAELERITLDGQNKTTIRHPGLSGVPGPAAHVIYVRGTQITIKGFTLTAGADGVHLSGPASAVIDGNTLVNNAGRGVHIDKGSVAQIINNTIRDNRGGGINISENSYARIGFFIPPSQALAPNIIRDNGGHGINVERASSAWIVGNTISGNKGNGVSVNRSSQADVVGNVIDANAGDGIGASHNSGVNLKSEASPRREGPNQTAAPRKNGGAGIRCTIGGYVDGPLGTLAGTQGAKDLDSTCVDRVSIE